jgi:hypothetical protein
MDNMKHQLWFLFWFLLWFITPTFCYAEGILKPLGELTETYTNEPVVHGSQLVGLRLGEAKGHLDVGRLRVLMPSVHQDELCLNLVTRDGQYSGRHRYDPDGAFPGLQDLKFNTPVRHPEVIGSYAAEDLAALVEVRARCGSGTPKSYLPVVFSNAGNSDTLVAYFNDSLSTLEASILQDRSSGVLVVGQCSHLNRHGSNTQFSRQCNFQLPLEAWNRAKFLQVKSIGLTGSTDVTVYPISINFQ